jgi:hypothetical protein
MRVCVFVEGSSEEQFFDAVIKPYVMDVNPRIELMWSMSVGGVGKLESQKYTKLRRIIEPQICTDNSAIYTTMFDYYAFPKDSIPNFTFTHYPNSYNMVVEREMAFRSAILSESKLASFRDRIEFHPHLMFHEYETLMYCNLDQLVLLRDSTDAKIRKLKSDTMGFENIEFINDSPQTAPSKRIIEVIPSYEFQKTSNALSVMKAIGLEDMLDKCQHFKRWIDWMCAI